MQYGSMAPMAMPAQLPKKSNVGLIVGLALGAVGFLVLGVGALAFFMVRNADENRSSSSYSTSYGSGGSSYSSSSSAKTEAYGIGDRVELDDSTWMVVDAKDLGRKISATSEFAEDEVKVTTGRFIQVHYRVTNTGKKQETLLDTPKIVDGKSREYGAMQNEFEYLPRGTKSAILETLQPSMQKDFYTIVEVPSDASDLKVQVTGLGFDADSKDIDIDL